MILNKRILFTLPLISALLVVLVTISWQANATHINPASSMTHYRWRNDDGSETTATWKANANTAITNVATNEQLRLRLGVAETAGGDFKYDATVQFSTDANDVCISGTWTTLDTSTTVWRIIDSASFTDGTATTQQITSGSFLAGEMKDAGNTASNITVVSQSTEHEWMIEGNGAAGGTDYWFRATDNASSLNDYTVCAKLTTAAAAASISITSDGAVDYGFMNASTTKDTTRNSLTDNQSATNDGTTTANFNIKGQNSAAWTLGTKANDDVYVHYFCVVEETDCLNAATSTWTKLTTNYQTLSTSILANNTSSFDLRLTTPTSTNNFTQQNVDVTVQAVNP